ELRVAQQKEALKKERETAEKIAAQAFSQQYLAGLLPSVFTSLRNHGYFYDPVEKGEPLKHSPFSHRMALLVYSECIGHASPHVGHCHCTAFIKSVVLILQILRLISSRGSWLRSTTN
ncbi:hypothetical protein GOODEAATRI_007415, partial [Goodea atripinnis]